MQPRSRKLGAFICALVIAPLLLMALGELRGPYDVDTQQRYIQPSWNHPLGTDALGRDMLARTLYAAGLSLRVVIQSVGLSFVLALLLGGIAGYWQGRWPDHLISWVISLLYTVPFILIVLAVFAVVSPTIDRAFLVIGCIGWAAPARLVRAEVAKLRSAYFVVVERAFGFSERQILWRTLLPLSFLPGLLSLLYFIPELIGIEVGLSFFGLGAQPPTPSLGRLIYEGLSEVYVGWHLTFFPACILLVLMAIIYGLSRHIAQSFNAKQEANA